MLDPRGHLTHWSKPWNVGQAEFDKVYAEAIESTDFAAERRMVLQTVEVNETKPKKTGPFA